MLPVIIEDYIRYLNNKAVHVEKRQFYYTSLVNIRNAVNRAIEKYDEERNFKK
jgi:hypothetical protein